MAADPRETRVAALNQRLAAEGLDGLIVTHLPNVRYLTGFSGSAAVTVVVRDAVIFVSDFRYQTQADEEIGDAARIEIAPTDVWDRVWKVLGDYARVAELGFEADAVSVKTAERMAKAPFSGKLRPVSGLIEALRASKMPAEIETIRQAASLATDALEATIPAIRPGATEREVAATLENELRLRGSEWHPFETIVASGPRSALPHARTGDRTIEQGEFVLLDFGAQVDGYCSDITRTVVVGQADERQRTVYHLVQEAQQTARETVRAGMTGQEADATARTVISARGFGDAFGHSLGHGLGLEVHEAPRVSKSNPDPLPEDAVVTIEPGIYLPGWGGVRIEDDVWLSDQGAELLSDGRAELREL